MRQPPAKQLLPIGNRLLVLRLVWFGKLPQFLIALLFLDHPLGQSLAIALLVAFGRASTEIENSAFVLLAPATRPITGARLPSELALTRHGSHPPVEAGDTGGITWGPKIVPPGQLRGQAMNRVSV